jgi:septum formation protein
VVLASASPRRRELLSAAGFSLRVVPADIDETPGQSEHPHALVARLASHKVAVVAAAVDDPDAVVVAADTAVVLDDVALNKPVDEADARRMLRALSGRAHRVLTGWAVRRGGRVVEGVTSTTVVFRTLSDADITRWLDAGAYADKAGAYAIQGDAVVFVAHVDGSLTNVIGLPVEVVAAAIATLLADGVSP